MITFSKSYARKHKWLFFSEHIVYVVSAKKYFWANKVTLMMIMMMMKIINNILIWRVFINTAFEIF